MVIMWRASASTHSRIPAPVAAATVHNWCRWCNGVSSGHPRWIGCELVCHWWKIDGLLLLLMPLMVLVRLCLNHLSVVLRLCLCLCLSLLYFISHCWLFWVHGWLLVHAGKRWSRGILIWRQGWCWWWCCCCGFDHPHLIVGIAVWCRSIFIFFDHRLFFDQCVSTAFAKTSTQNVVPRFCFFHPREVFWKETLTIVSRKMFQLSEWQKVFCGPCFDCNLVDMGKLRMIEEADNTFVSGRYLSSSSVLRCHLDQSLLVSHGKVEPCSSGEIKIVSKGGSIVGPFLSCLLYTSPSPRD